MDSIYLDYNATTPLAPEVLQAMQPFLTTVFGNPSSNHRYGRAAKQAVEQARNQVASTLGCKPEELVFTSGGSEANNQALKGVAYALRGKGNHLITSAIEHPAVLNVCNYLQKNGFCVTILPVDNYGLVSPDLLESAITEKTILVSIMHANNEIGTIEPLSELCAIAHHYGVLVHSDCAQSLGKIPVRIDELGVDLLSIAGHKLYAPKGVGALVIREGVPVEPLIHGASHEQNRRAGTENVAGVVGLGVACTLVESTLLTERTRMARLRDKLELGLLAIFPGLIINGHPKLRLPNTSSASFPGYSADQILVRLPSVAASAGAACHSGGVTVSHVLRAMSISLRQAKGTIRFSVGRRTTEQEIELAIKEVSEVLSSLAAD